MRLLVLAIFALTIQVANAEKGESCAKVFVENKSAWTFSRLVQWCNENKITDAHADVARFFIKRGSNWEITKLMEWAKQEKLTSAQVKCGLLYEKLDAAWKPADLLLYCRNQGYTKSEMKCASGKNPRSVDQLNSYLSQCRKTP